MPPGGRYIDGHWENKAEPKIEASVTRVLALDDPDAAAVARQIYDTLEARAEADLARLGAEGRVEWRRYGYLRYRGQGYEIQAPAPAGAIDDGYPAAFAAAFHAAYEQAYGYHDPDAAIEAVDWHLVATVRQESSGLDLGWRAPTTSAAAQSRMTWTPEAGGFADTPIYDRRLLGLDARIEGPAIIEDPEATIVLPPDCSGRVTARGHLIIDIGRRS